IIDRALVLRTARGSGRARRESRPEPQTPFDSRSDYRPTQTYPIVTDASSVVRFCGGATATRRTWSHAWDGARTVLARPIRPGTGLTVGGPQRAERTAPDSRPRGCISNDRRLGWQRYDFLRQR